MNSENASAFHRFFAHRKNKDFYKSASVRQRRQNAAEETGFEPGKSGHGGPDPAGGPGGGGRDPDSDGGLRGRRAGGGSEGAAAGGGGGGGLAPAAVVHRHTRHYAHRHH